LYLVNVTVFDHENSIGGACQSIVVGDHHKRDAGFAIHLAHQFEDFGPGMTVEISPYFLRLRVSRARKRVVRLRFSISSWPCGADDGHAEAAE
jgi:hypothetical protein